MSVLDRIGGWLDRCIEWVSDDNRHSFEEIA